MTDKTYIAIDLKSFFASVECVERGLDPLTTHLVVADTERTEKTICLAVSPSLKAYGIPGRARLFEVIETLRGVNAQRRRAAPDRVFSGASYNAAELERDPALEADYIAAVPRMAFYIRYSARIYEIYLKYVAPEDVHVYSIDEVFIDATPYLSAYGMRAYDFASMLVREVLSATGITATAGVGSNLYLCKVAMDIVAKHIEPDRDGVRIAALDEQTYRRALWTHRPLTDFWRIGGGYAKKLEAHGLFTMGDIARCSLGGSRDFHNEELLYRLFGVNAELLIDHAWGWEPCTMQDIKAYRPEVNSVSAGQVLQRPYTFEQGRLIACEMAEAMAMDLLEQGLVCDQLVLTVGYDIANLAENAAYHGEIKTDYYGRKAPRSAHGSANLGGFTASSDRLIRAVSELYDRIVDRGLLIRRFNLTANHATDAANAPRRMEQIDFFTDPAAEAQKAAAAAALEKEKRKQQAMLDIKKKYGKNAIIKGMSLREGATARARNRQIGGHKA